MPADHNRRRIAFIFPIYNEEENIELLHRTVAETITPLADEYDFSFIYIDDGSSDHSMDLLTALSERDDRVTVIELSRNFGHQLAVTAGLDLVDADAAIIMDSDMQDPPRVALELIEKWEEGFDVVYAQRRSRQDSVFKRLTAGAFYWLLRKVASVDIPRNTGDFRLIDRKVVDELRKYRERDRFLRGLVSYIGFKQTAVLFDRDKRHAGVTGYPLRKMLRFAADGILGFSVAPLRMISRLGYLISLLSFLGILYVLGVKLFAPATAVPGWAFITAAMFFLGGIQIIMLGVLGSYIGRTYSQVQNRPLYGVASVRTGSLDLASAEAGNTAR
ncbi:glycosyltransferase family 2 protein [Amycolatopsis regifaucium]|uniref:Glycosyltransferase n=1 Tax=Amycolatopsis regifaucium TaxID=546365 RepID=A0A154MHN4_9PSEU|nr:glycosyltransferase family 2 protein [Amycolatopsis regifaucium]KZB83895.1 glycosyltransferase [Amycolatopsis regifaucium]OKA06661.1 glycosyltransferase [Amycolatopsis regifaucium]SFH23147.1 dolichol-phosphate mannosyltransferase [Amycolatopsis regifaucium]